MRILKKLFYTITDFFIPNLCLICDKKLYDSYFNICGECIRTNPKLNQITIDNYLDRNFPNEKYFDYFYSLYRFEKEQNIQKIIHLLKYERKSKVGIQLGMELGKELVHIPWFNNIDFLIPIPIHYLRKAERGGYNQSEMICKGINKITNINFTTKSLKRIFYTSTQTKLTKEQRASNLKNAFKVTQPELINNKNIALIDDVITTGSTIKECLSTLKNYSPKSVAIISACVTID